MSLSKLRPVGSRVPLPKTVSSDFSAPWAGHYHPAYVNSGTAALSLAVKLSLRCKVIKQDPEVILPAYGCPDLIAAVVAQGARPVLVDLVEDRPWMDLEAVKAALTDNTVGIVSVGFLGIPERLGALRRLADDAGAMLIEDSAQGFPPFSSGNGLADYVVLSFGRGKPINLMGGGALLIRKDHMAESASDLAALTTTAVSGGPAWQLRRRLFNLLLTRPLYGLVERMPFLRIGSTVYHPLERVCRQLPVEGLLEAGVEGFNQRKDSGAVYSEALAELSEKGWTLLPDEEQKPGHCPAHKFVAEYLPGKEPEPEGIEHFRMPG
ncbi:hypothetical protein C9993_06400 [Marinobacter sp. Z-F4-2]|nr:hypothetical protein C9993_06400 [Marinobacter sp. Z-F4-2]